MKAIRLFQPGQRLVETDIDPAPLGPKDVSVRIEAAGICRSDVHYRSGARPVARLPVTPGHEVSGVVEGVGEHVTRVSVGDRVAAHYLVSCGECASCKKGREQFCESGEMIGLDRDGGYAELITVPERNLYEVPEQVPFEVAAIMMCSSSTSLHALRRGRFAEGESVAVVGCGGLGMSAIKIAFALGADEVFALDINKEKLAMASDLGATPVGFGDHHDLSVDVALELVGLPETMRAAVDVLGVRGRAVAVGITDRAFPLNSFADLVMREAEVIGAMDHLGSDIEELFGMVVEGRIDLSDVVTGTVSLDATEVNDALDRLEAFEGGIRTVIKP